VAQKNVMHIDAYELGLLTWRAAMCPSPRTVIPAGMLSTKTAMHTPSPHCFMLDQIAFLRVLSMNSAAKQWIVFPLFRISGI
jgi:hypothetical protein